MSAQEERRRKLENALRSRRSLLRQQLELEIRLRHVSGLRANREEEVHDLISEAENTGLSAEEWRELLRDLHADTARALACHSLRGC